MRLRDYFVKHPDGSWEPRQAVTIKSGMGEIALSPGVRFQRGVEFMGLDIAALCEQDAYL